MVLRLVLLLVTLVLASTAHATPTTIDFWGRAFFLHADSGLNDSVQTNDIFRGRITVDLAANVPDRPDDPNIPGQGLHFVQIDDFQLTIGDYSIQGGGVSNLSVFDDAPSALGADVVRFGPANLQSTPGFAPNGTLFMAFSFREDTGTLTDTLDFLFPTDLANWTGAGFTFTEFVPGAGFVPKFLARISGWAPTLVPEPTVGLMLGLAAILGIGRRQRARA